MESFSDQIKRLMSNIAFFGTIPMLPWEKQVPKNSERSEDCRLEGNKVFKYGAFEMALQFYNAGLCYAPQGCKEIALIYGNRSAVYCEMGEYKLALENIKLARENGFPVENMAKLDAREEKCKNLMETRARDNDFDASSFFKLSHPPNKKIPFIVDCLELRKDERYGRGVYTTKDLKTGDIISIESPLFSWNNEEVKGPYCSFCAETRKGSLVPCSHCTSVMYCSEECREKAALFHAYEGFNEGNTMFGSTLRVRREAFRIAGGVDELFELLKGNENKTIFDFDFSNPYDPSYERNMLIALNGLSKGITSPIKVTEDEMLNLPPFNIKPRTNEEREQLLKFAIDQYKIVSTNISMFKGSSDGVFLFKSLMNHSCVPDVQPYKIGGKMVLVVTRPVKAGSQIFSCCCIHALLATKQERLERLKIHPFICNCEACVNDWDPANFPRKDNTYSGPRWAEVMKKFAPKEAMKQFKENCKYIDQNYQKMPCFEVQMKTLQNQLLIQSLSEEVENQ